MTKKYLNLKEFSKALFSIVENHFPSSVDQLFGNLSRICCLAGNKKDAMIDAFHEFTELKEQQVKDYLDSVFDNSFLRVFIQTFSNEAKKDQDAACKFLQTNWDMISNGIADLRVDHPDLAEIAEGFLLLMFAEDIRLEPKKFTKHVFFGMFVAIGVQMVAFGKYPLLATVLSSFSVYRWMNKYFEDKIEELQRERQEVNDKMAKKKSSKKKVAKKRVAKKVTKKTVTKKVKATKKNVAKKRTTKKVAKKK